MPVKYDYNAPVVQVNNAGALFAVTWSYPLPGATDFQSTVYTLPLSNGGGAWQSSGDLPVTLYAASGAASIGSNVYAFGGSIDLHINPVQAVYEIVINSAGGYQNINPCTSLATGLAGATAVAYNGSILLVGGYTTCVPALSALCGSGRVREGRGG